MNEIQQIINKIKDDREHYCGTLISINESRIVLNALQQLLNEQEEKASDRIPLPMPPSPLKMDETLIRNTLKH